MQHAPAIHRSFKSTGYRAGEVIESVLQNAEEPHESSFSSAFIGSHISQKLM
jgi:hypothetical protein